MFNTIFRYFRPVRIRLGLFSAGLFVSVLVLALSGCQTAAKLPETDTVTQPPVTVTATITKTVTINPTPDSTPGPTASIPSTDNSIVVSYTSLSNTTLTDNTGQAVNPRPGYIFLTATLDIENHGYEQFETFYGYFTMVVDNVEYRCTRPDLVEGYLDDVRLLNGGRISGKLLYEVPPSALANGFNFSYSEKDKATGQSFNIQWLNLNY